MTDWVSVQGGAKNDKGEYMAQVNGQWKPAKSIAKNDKGEYLAVFDTPTQTPTPKKEIEPNKVNQFIGNTLNNLSENVKEKESLVRGMITGAGDLAITPVQMIMGEGYSGQDKRNYNQSQKSTTSELLSSIGWKPDLKNQGAESIGEVVAPGSGLGKLGIEGIKAIKPFASKIIERNKNIIPDLLGKRVASSKEELSKIGSEIEQSATKKSTEQIGKIEKQGSAEAQKFTDKANIANTAESHQKNIIQTGIKDLSGVETKADITGKMTPQAKTLDDIGNDVRGRVEKTMDTLKDARSTKAEQNFSTALTEAKQKESLGNTIKQTKDFAKLTSYLDNKLSIITDPTLRNELTMLKRALTEGAPVKLSEGERRVYALRHGTTLDQVPHEIQLPPTFEGIEIMRRRLGDSAFGAPVEGYKSISREMSKDIYDMVGKSMREFSPSFDKYLTDYKTMSEPLNVFSNKVGRALVGAEEKGDYYKVDAQKIADKVFQSKEGYRSLIEALNGNRQEAESIAKQWFANQLQNKSPQEVVKFLQQDKMRSVLDDMPSVKTYLQERIVKPLMQAEQRSTAFGLAKESATKKVGEIQKTTADKVQSVQKIKEGISSDVSAIESQKSPSAAYDKFNAKLANLKASGLITDEQLAKYQESAENVMKVGKEADKNKNLAKLYFYIGGSITAYYKGSTLLKSY